jgi:hypothetical protein
VPIFLLKYDRWAGTFPGLRQHWTSAASLCIKSLALILFSFARVVWGLTHLSGTTLKVRHMREPFFVRPSDGSIQNRYEVNVTLGGCSSSPVAVHLVDLVDLISYVV